MDMVQPFHFIIIKYSSSFSMTYLFLKCLVRLCLILSRFGISCPDIYVLPMKRESRIVLNGLL